MASVETDFTQRRRRVLAGGGIAAALLYVGGAAIYEPRIESDLEQRVPEAIAQEAGVSGISAEFSGQDGTIECDGPIENPSEVEAIALGVHGVNKIKFADECLLAGSTPVTTPEPDPQPTTEPSEPATVPDSAAPNYETVSAIVAGDPGYGQLAAHLAKSDLSAALGDPDGGPYTVFAPSSDAFNAVPADALAVIESDPSVRDEILGYHVVQGALTLDDLADGTELTTISGKTLVVTGAGEMATISTSNAHITGGPIEAKNGVVYTIDTVMIPDGLDLAPTQEATAATSAVFDAGAITLNGAVATEADRAVLVEAAARKVGAENVTDNLVIADGAISGDDAGSLGQLILGMGEQLVSGEAGANADGLYVNGFYADEQANQNMLNIAALLGATADLEPRPEADAETAGDLQAQLNNYVAENPILFESASANLSSESNAVLDTLAAGLQQFGGLSVVVQGHTDSDGSDANNQALSEQRASAVVDALVERGVPADTISSEGFGETQLILVDGAEDKAASRRVVFELTAAQ